MFLSFEHRRDAWDLKRFSLSGMVRSEARLCELKRKYEKQRPRIAPLLCFDLKENERQASSGSRCGLNGGWIGQLVIVLHTWGFAKPLKRRKAHPQMPSVIPRNQVLSGHR